MDIELQFTLKEETDPNEVLARLEEADRDQVFGLFTSEDKLFVSSQIDHTPEEIQEFVRKAVGNLIVD